jgi:hypothetical protein
MVRINNAIDREWLGVRKNNIDDQPRISGDDDIKEGEEMMMERREMQRREETLRRGLLLKREMEKKKLAKDNFHEKNFGCYFSEQL